MAPPALLPRASAVRPLAPASSSPLRVHVVAAARTPRPPPRTARPVSLLCTPRSNVDDAAAAAGGDADKKPYRWPWGDEDPPKYVEEDIVDAHLRFVRESREAVAALKAAAADACRALVDNFAHIRSLKTIYDVEDYHIGMPFGVLIACIGCYQLWKLDPSTFLDVVLGYAFYRFSVLGSNIRRKGFSNDLFGRLKFVIVVIMAVKDFRKNLAPIDAIRTPVYALYLMSFLYDIIGLKKYGKYYFAMYFTTMVIPEAKSKIAGANVTTKNEPWVLASQVDQCFFITDPSKPSRVVVRRGKRNIIGMNGVANEQDFDKYGDPKMEDDDDDEVPYTTRRSRTTLPKGRPFKRRTPGVPGLNYSTARKKGKKIVKR